MSIPRVKRSEQTRLRHNPALETIINALNLQVSKILGFASFIRYSPEVVEDPISVSLSHLSVDVVTRIA